MLCPDVAQGTEPDAASEAQRLAQELLPRCHEITVGICPAVAEAVPAVVPPTVDTAMEDLVLSSEQTIGAILALLAFGVVPKDLDLPPGTLKLLQNIVDGGGDVTSILRAYRVGHELLWAFWSRHVTDRLDPVAANAVLDRSSAQLFSFFDLACESVVEVYRRSFEDPTVTRGGRTSRRSLIDRVVGREPVDLDAVADALGYDVRGSHVALVVSRVAVRSDARRGIAAVARSVGASFLAEPVGHGTWWAWLGWTAAPPDDALGIVARTATRGSVVGMGTLLAGRDGFRRSLEQAQETERMARASPTRVTGVTRYHDVEVAALLCADPVRARALAADRLGELGLRDETGRRLRETLRAFLSSGRNKARTADVLHVHHKTVAYRVAQAESLLGRSVGAAALDLEIALTIDLTLNGP